MARISFKKTVKNEVLRPFSLSSENPWTRLQYRFDPAEAWQNALVSPFIVLPGNREDVRTDVLHSFDIAVDLDALRTDGFDPGCIELLVLARDAFAKKIHTFQRRKLGPEGAYAVNIARSDLEQTSMAARIDFQVMLVAAAELRAGGRLIRRGGRLVSHTVSISAERKGYSFQFAKTSPDDFEARGFPRSTTFTLEVPQPEQLIEACDDVAGVLTVLVHEDAWATLQEIRSGDRVGESLGTIFLADVIFDVLRQTAGALKSGNGDLDESSVVMRLLRWMAEKSGTPVEDLQSQLSDQDGIRMLQARVQESLRLTGSIQKVRFETETVA